MGYLYLKNVYAKPLCVNAGYLVLVSETGTHIVEPKGYNEKNREYEGIPVYSSSNRGVFNLLEGSVSLSDIVSRKVTWDCSDEFLSSFSKDEIEEALYVEMMFSRLGVECRVAGCKVVGDGPASFEIECGSDQIALICAKILKDGTMSVRQAEIYFSSNKGNNENDK